MKVTVCEIHSAADELGAQWERLTAHLQESRSELLLLPEMPFHPWMFGDSEYRPEQWQAAEQAHVEWLEVLAELPCAVAATRPITEDARRVNRGFTLLHGHYADVHTKHYVPAEDGFWEAAWYQPGAGIFETFTAAQANCGMLICTDVWFMEHAQQYGRDGAHLLLNPRANYGGAEDRALWQAATQVAAFSSGTWVATSNLLPADAEPGTAAHAWVMSPDGEVVAETTAEQPFSTADIDLDAAVQAKRRYPCYIR
ncbi:carbon-nitrogen hydrolase family protein [Nocardia sp. NBC_01503]|uniref:carbon-nitrogen hydrolase family protein n=1 Tax=Nocardia sp. NBC_01503 TaxID=2975997 RepID=UPI002E7BA96E|nr:carbon-nitrogen hydrolase family protein [Nocardia sp. NBC_01503]WTL32118.1 carbon-nitrogen hydrolase family protein [Nocardia sp. NBC_01503]